MNWYFIAILALEVFGMGINLAKHGEDKDGKYNFWLSLSSTVINLFLIIMAIKKGF